MKKVLSVSLIIIVSLLIISLLRIPSAAAEETPDLTIAMGNSGNWVYDESFRHIVGMYERDTGRKVEMKYYDSKDIVMNINTLAGEDLNG